MQLIKRVLELPIKRGIINWAKLEAGIHAALNTVDNKFEKVRDPSTGECIQMRTEDALTTGVKVKDKSYTYKLYSPRFKNGNLYCSGFEMGYGRGANVIWKPNTKVIF